MTLFSTPLLTTLFIVVAPQTFHITEGQRLTITTPAQSPQNMRTESPNFRALLHTPSKNITHATLSFVYEGPTAIKKPLLSGDLRMQWGLKLHADDPCNVLYAMVRLSQNKTLGAAPHITIVVQQKTNHTAHTSKDCTNHGYTTVPPTLTQNIEPLAPNTSHTLEAQLNTQQHELTLYYDHQLAWRGKIPEHITHLDPIGIRSDNVRLTFSLNES